MEKESDLIFNVSKGIKNIMESSVVMRNQSHQGWIDCICQGGRRSGYLK